MMSSLAIITLCLAGQNIGVSREIELDPTNRSSCVVGEKVTLNLEGMRWKKWEDFCKDLEKYLRVDKEPIDKDSPREAERLLAETGYFQAVTCTATVATAELTCFMSPQQMVRDVEIEGSLPFALLEEDIRRQIFLRPGVVLKEEEGPLEKQEDRLRRYLERHGFFDSKVKITPKEGKSGSQPNEPVEIETYVDAGTSVTVENIEITGAPAEFQEDIEDQIRHYWVFNIFPRRFQPEQFEDDVDELTRQLQKDGYPEARLTGDFELDLPNGDVNIKVAVDSGPKLELVFQGNKEIDADDLEEATTFIEAGSLDAVEIEASTEKLKEEYQKEGYYAVKIVPEVSDAEGKKVITFKIDEGPRAEISSVIMRGNKLMTSSELADLVSMKTKPSGLLRNGRWVDSYVRRDASQLRTSYRLRGYAVTTIDVGRKILPDGSLEVLFDINEGPLRKVAKLDIKGIPEGIDKEELTKRMRLVEGAPFVEGRLVSDRRELLTVLAASGYPKAVVNRKLKVPYKTEPGEAYFEYVIEAGERAAFGGFLVRGAFRTAEGVIADELSLKPGEPLDLLVLSDAKQRLRALGVFSSVDLRPLDQWKSAKDTWLLVEVTERDHQTLDGVFSFSTDDLLSVGADFRDQNFIGRAIHLQLSARLSNASEFITERSIGRRDYIQANIQAPHPLGLPFNAEYRAFYDYEDKTAMKDEMLEGFTRRRVGAGAAISRPLVTLDMCSVCPEITGRLGYELASVEGINLGPQMSRELENTPNVTIGRIAPSLSFRKLDSPVDPRSGYASDIRFEFGHSALAGPLNGGASFWRFLSSAEGYLNLGTPIKEQLNDSTTLGGPVVLAQNLVYAVGHPFFGSHELPITETFDYGGDLSVRGIRERASLDSVQLANYLFRGTTELRYYFLDTSFGSFQVAALADFGMVSRHMGSLTKDPTIAAGGALRYITPVGPVSVAYAYPFVRAEGISDRGRLHISFGYSF